MVLLRGPGRRRHPSGPPVRPGDVGDVHAGGRRPPGRPGRGARPELNWSAPATCSGSTGRWCSARSRGPARPLPRRTSWPPSSSPTPTCLGCCRPVGEHRAGADAAAVDRAGRAGEERRRRPAPGTRCRCSPRRSRPFRRCRSAGHGRTWKPGSDDSVTDPETARRQAEALVRSQSAESSPGCCARGSWPGEPRLDRRRGARDQRRGGGRAGPPVVGAAADADAWPGGPDTIDLPVYHWWRFRTTENGTFEELARRLRTGRRPAAGLGSRTVDVSDRGTRPDATSPRAATVSWTARCGRRRRPRRASVVGPGGAGGVRREMLGRSWTRPPATRESLSGGERPAGDRDTRRRGAAAVRQPFTGQQTVPDDRAAG